MYLGDSSKVQIMGEQLPFVTRSAQYVRSMNLIPKGTRFNSNEILINYDKNTKTKFTTRKYLHNSRRETMKIASL